MTQFYAMKLIYNKTTHYLVGLTLYALIAYASIHLLDELKKLLVLTYILISNDKLI